MHALPIYKVPTYLYPTYWVGVGSLLSVRSTLSFCLVGCLHGLVVTTLKIQGRNASRTRTLVPLFADIRSGDWCEFSFPNAHFMQLFSGSAQRRRNREGPARTEKSCGQGRGGVWDDLKTSSQIHRDSLCKKVRAMPSGCCLLHTYGGNTLATRNRAVGLTEEGPSTDRESKTAVIMVKMGGAQRLSAISPCRAWKWIANTSLESRILLHLPQGSH